MKRKLTRFLAGMLCFAMLLGMAPAMRLFTATAAGTEPIHEDHGEDSIFTTELTGDVGELSAGSYYLTGDVKLTDALTVSGEVKLCLNGCTITGAAAPYFTVSKDATLTICDCAGGGKIDGSALTIESLSSLIGVSQGGIFDFYGGTIIGCTNSKRSGGVYVAGTFNMYAGAAITSCHGGNGGAIFIENGTFNMRDGEISGNNATHGAAMWLNGGSATIYDGLITGNEAVERAGAIYNNTGTVTINGGTIEENTAGIYGGAIFTGTGSTTMTGGTISNNECESSAGAIYGGFTMTGGMITGNTAKYGGAIRNETAKFTMTGGKITDNITSDTTTADVYIKSTGSAEISGTAVIDQGGIKATDDATITIGNLKKGASIYAKSAVTVSDGTVYVAPDSTTGLTRYTWKALASNGMNITCAGYSIENDWLKLEKDKIDSAVTLNASYDAGIDSTGHTLTWTSDNEDVATVDENGVVTVKSMGSAKITVTAYENGQKTDCYASVNLQVGEYLKVLAIGNDSSRDGMFYLDKLAQLTGIRIQAAYLYKQDANLRDHAKALATNASDYAYYVTDLSSGDLECMAESTTAAEVLEALPWDVVILQTGTTVGWPTTYNSDLEYLVDYVRGEEPNAKLYWNMTWANEDDCDTGYAYFDIEYDGTIDSGYAGDQKIMYNAIVDSMNKYITLGEDGFDGRILTGTAIQKLRETYGDTLTRDGYHLSLKGGRLTAAMTMLAELLPVVNEKLGTVLTVDTLWNNITTAELDTILTGEDTDAVSFEGAYTADSYVNNSTNLDLVKDAVKTASETEDPVKLNVDKRPTSSSTTIFQTTLPVSPRFPDVITMDDGSLVACATLHVAHATWPANGLREGSSKIVVFSGDADGLTWKTEEPLLTIDEAKIEEWGIAQFSDRYDRIRNGADANSVYVASNYGDFNMEYFQMDMNGNGEKKQVLWATFSCAFYAQDGTITKDSYFVWSYDNGKNWEQPQQYTDYKGQPSLKRGDAAVFEDEKMIMTTSYGYNTVGAALWQWNVETQKWVLVAGGNIPNTAPEENGEVWDGGEVALITLDGNTVYGFCRPAGVVYKMSMDDVQINDNFDWTMDAWSEDIWEEIANEEKTIHQPVFTKLDDTHILVNWASGYENPRDIYGKVFNVNGSWTDTDTIKIHDYATTNQHDTGNPGSTVLQDGRVIVVHYDTEYDSLIANFIDPMNDEDYLPYEVGGGLETLDKQYFFQEDFADADLVSQLETADAVTDGMLTLANGVSMKENVAGSHTIDAVLNFTAANGTATVKTVAGDVVITPTDVAVGGQTKALSLALNTAANVRVSVVGTDLYIKVWQGTEPDAWTLEATGDITDQKTGVTGTNAKLDSLAVSKRMTLELQESISGYVQIVSGENVTPDVQLSYTILPVQGQATWTSSDPNVVSVDQNGVVTFHSVGTATIWLTVSGITKTCAVTVNATPAELSGAGTTTTLFADDFDSYTNATNGLYTQGSSKYTFAYDTSKAHSYDIREEVNGKYLAILGDTAQLKTQSQFTGDYTVQFDYRFHSFTGGTSILYSSMWQGSKVYARFNFRQGGAQYIYKDGSQQLSYPTDSSWTLSNGSYQVNQWGTVKMTRVDGALFVKFWQGEEEPAEWTNVLYSDVLDTDLASCFFIQTIGNPVNRTDDIPVDIDNLIITQQIGAEEEPAPELIELSGTTMTLGNSLSLDFVVDTSKLDSSDTEHYAVITKYYADGRANKTVKIHQDDWEVYQGTLYRACFTGIAAKEMCDRVDVVFCNSKGQPVTNAKNDSIYEYAMRMLARDDVVRDTELRAVYVDMLNYGAAAQKAFTYDTENLANRSLTEAQKAYATGEVETQDNREQGTGYAGTTLKLDSQIKLSFVFYDNTLGEDLSSLYAIATYKDHYGEEKKVRIEGSDFEYYAEGYHFVPVTGMAVADHRQIVTCTVYNSDGNTIASATDSVEGYVARNKDKVGEVAIAIMKFGESSFQHFR